jgi:hypothetical protein
MFKFGLYHFRLLALGEPGVVEDEMDEEEDDLAEEVVVDVLADGS